MRKVHRRTEKLFGDAEKLEINGDQLTAHLNPYQFLWLHLISTWYACMQGSMAAFSDRDTII